MPVVIQSTFIGNFKLGDNINQNLSTLGLLYQFFDDSDEVDRSLLYKPIILIIGSIAEAVLHDLHFRINHFTSEGVKNITESALEYIRGKNIDKFAKYIASAKKHDLFDEADTRFYAQLDELRKLRNRIHIQNVKYFDPDEKEVFTQNRKIMAEKILEKTLTRLSEKYSRKPDYVGNFVLPWDSHFEENDA